MNKIYIKILPVLFLIIFMTSIAMSQNTNEINKKEQQMNTDYIEVSLNYDVLKQLGYEKQDFIATDDGESFFLLTKAGETVKILDIPSNYEYEGKKYKITQIESKIFESFSSLTNITIPNSVTKIGNRAFNHCTSLKKITLPDTIDEIPESTFSECFSLKSISLPKNIKKIGETSFVSIFFMLLLSKCTFGKLYSNVSQIDESNSFAQIMSKPAFSNPLSRPPAPEKRLTTLLLFIIFTLNKKCHKLYVACKIKNAEDRNRTDKG